MYSVIKCYLHGNQGHVKNVDLRHPSCTVVMYRRKSASPVHSVLMTLKSVDVWSPHAVMYMWVV